MIDLVIKFGKEFIKLPECCPSATLLQVIPSHFESLSDWFTDYDGRYFEDEKINYWVFPDKGACLILLFLAGDELFTSVRKLNLENQRLYCGNVGRSFRIEMERI